MICRPLLSRATMKSVVHVVPVAMTAVVHAPLVTVVRPLVHVVLLVPMRLLLTAVTSLQKHWVPMPINPPFSASAR
jgi:hypothetical protein